MSAPTQKRCYYEVLGLPQSCTQDEIRTAYKKMALQRHPDKLVQSGISSADANALFQELVHAYEVLSDPKERSWYDSHRSQILFSQHDVGASSNGGEKNMNSPFPDLFSYFSPSCYTDYSNKKTGFYKVYGDVFDSVYANEVRYCGLMGLRSDMVKRAPLMGDLESDYNSQVNAFYGYWMNFCTVMDFGWVDKWDAGNGMNRRSRRVMEEENKKLRKKARKEFNETVRGLADFVKKRDKRVIDMMMKKEKEREKKREEELARKKEREREKLEKARLYEEPEWSRVEEVEEIEEVEEEEEEEKKEFYCAACSKKFKSDKQWKNHEKSKKHKEKVDELRRTFVEEDQEEGLEDDEDVDEEYEEEVGVQKDVEKDEECGGNDDEDVRDGFVSADDDVDDDLVETFKDSVQLDEEKSEGEAGCDDADISKTAEQTVEESGGSADDSAILEAMLSGRRNKRNQPKAPSERNVAESEDEMDSMAYNNKKAKKKRRAKKEKGKAAEAEATKKGDDDNDFPSEENEARNDFNFANEDEDDTETSCSKQTGTKAGKQSVERKEISKRDAEPRPKNSTKGRKQKSKNSDPFCEKCGEEFESRSKLHKHLKDTGHATLKSR